MKSSSAKSSRVAVSAFCALMLAGASAQAATFLVNSNADTGDSVAGDGSCSTGIVIVVATNPIQFAEECTLRAALEESNSLAGSDVIEFSSFLPTVAGIVEISPATSLPPILGPVTLDGYSHPSYDDAAVDATPIINLLGSSAGANTPGLTFLPGADGSIVRGLAITNFTGSGILISAFFSDGPEDIVIQGNHIGITRGIFYFGNDEHGIQIENSDNNRIGAVCDPIGGCQGKRNVIAANTLTGISINASTGNRIAGNYIGIDRSGTATFISFGGSTRNGENGVFVSESSTGNFIGDTGGFFVVGSGITPVAAGNLISGNTFSGINVQGAGNTIVANQIGTNAAGTAAVGNLGSGIFVGGDDTVIGGSGLNSNLISGNGSSGISVDTETGGDPLRLSIFNNRIGVNAAADAPVGNGNHGMLLWGSNHDIDDNIIGGNANHGISDISSGTVFLRNYLGTNAEGDNLGNGDAGIRMSEGNQVLGEVGSGNIIGFNANGIVGGSSSFNVRIVSNFIGTNPEGDDIGNLGHGIQIDAPEYQVGEINGRIIGQANTIGFNGGDGVFDTGFNTTIQGNYIGTNVEGEVLPNGGAGIRAETIAGPGAAIGATLSTLDFNVNGAGNIVAHNAQGIVVDNTEDLPVRGNQLLGNGGPGIDLEGDGVTNNDASDADTGANNLQNRPILDASVTAYNSGTGEVEVRLGVTSTVANAAYPLTFDFYIHDPWLQPGDEASMHIGSATYTALEAGFFVTRNFTPTLGTFTPNIYGDLFGGLRATATDANGNTSEFSLGNVPVPEPSRNALLAGGLLGLIGLLDRRRTKRGPAVRSTPERAR
ncbi:MAG: beta strand repeat-containing protein [Myxococcota bacterium]